MVLEADFSFERVQVGGLVILKGDRFIETYYTRRWYNVFEVHDRDDDSLKGYYCNVGYPAQLQDGQVSYRDLALDLVVLSDGQQQVLDEDEFEALALPEAVRRKALEGLKQLQELFGDFPK